MPIQDCGNGSEWVPSVSLQKSLLSIRRILRGWRRQLKAESFRKIWSSHQPATNEERKKASVSSSPFFDTRLTSTLLVVHSSLLTRKIIIMKVLATLFLARSALAFHVPLPQHCHVANPAAAALARPACHRWATHRKNPRKKCEAVSHERGFT